MHVQGIIVKKVIWLRYNLVPNIESMGGSWDEASLDIIMMCHIYYVIINNKSHHVRGLGLRLCIKL